MTKRNRTKGQTMKGKQFLFHRWHSSCYSCYKPGFKSWM